MRRSAALSLTSILLLAAATSAAQDEPLDGGTTEQVRVNLVLLETLVLDRRGRTVSDLTHDDFILKIQHRRVPIDVLDVECPAGRVDDARNVEWDKGEGFGFLCLSRLSQLATERKRVWAMAASFLLRLEQSDTVSPSV